MIERQLNIIKEAAKWQNKQITEGGVKDALHNWMEAIPKKAVAEMKKIMHGSLLRTVSEFDPKMRRKLVGELDAIAKKYKIDNVLPSTYGTAGQVAFEYFDTFYPEREPSKNKKQTSPKVTVYHMKDSVETVPEEDTLLEHDGTKVGFMNRKNIADGWFEQAPKGDMTSTPFKFYPPTSGKPVLMTQFQVEDLVKDLTKVLQRNNPVLNLRSRPRTTIPYHL